MNAKEKIFIWIDDIFNKGIPLEVRAIYINLVESYETVEVEFFGIDKLDPNDIDWACDYMYSSESTEVLSLEIYLDIGRNLSKKIQISFVNI